MEDFTHIEKQIFEMLSETPGKLISRDRLSTARPKLNLYTSNAVDVHIKNMRKKLPANMEIVTKRGMGYFLQEKQK